MKSFMILVAATNGQETVCTKPDASNFPGGMIRCEEPIKDGSPCIFMCHDSANMVLQGINKITCNNGEFDNNGDFPTCIHKDDVICDGCCDWSFRDIDNAVVTCENDNVKGSACTVECDDGFVLEGNDKGKCTRDGWNKEAPTCVEEVYTTLEPPTTLNDDHVVDWYTENFGFQIIESDPQAGLFKVAWNEGLYVDDNNDVQFGGNANFPGVRRQWLRYTDESGKRQKVHFTPTDNQYTLQVPDYLQVYTLELMVKFWSGQVFADTKFTEAGQEPTTTEKIETYTTITTTTEPRTTAEPTTMIVDNFNNINLRAEELTGTSTMLRWNGQQGNGRVMVKQWIRFKSVNPEGEKNLVPVDINASEYKLEGLTPGYTYEFEIIRQFQQGRKERGTDQAKMTSMGGDGGSIGGKCVVCHGDESNDACNARAESCDPAMNQMCQTVVRVENGLAPRFEKRCKQRQACKNERAIYKNTGICQGGTRTQNVDVCVYCCEGDYCNVSGPWMDTLVEAAPRRG